MRRIIYYFRDVLLVLVILAGVYMFVHEFHSKEQQFIWQARSFISGNLSVEAPFDGDMVVKNGKYYWPNGPFPSLVVLPFVYLVGNGVEQGHIQALLVVFLIYTVIRYAHKKGYSFVDSVYLCAAFIFGSVLVGIFTQPSSWYFSQVVTVWLLTMMLVEWEQDRRYILLGVYQAALIATRPTAAVFGIYILWSIMRNALHKRKFVYSGLAFVFPVVVSVCLLGWFNFVRFGSVLDNGYLTNNIGLEVESLRALGLFSIQHVPMNIYWYFFAGPDPVTNGSAHMLFPFVRYNHWGLSILLISPFFLFALLTLRLRSAYIRNLWRVTGGTLTLLLMYYATGWYSFGPRYTADFMPVLLVLLLHAFPHKSLTEAHKSIIIISALVNTYLIYATRIL